MPTVNRNLYNVYTPGLPVDDGNNRLLLNQYGGIPLAPVAPANNGDTLAIKLYFFDPGSGSVPFRCRRYAGGTAEVNLLALGNLTYYGIAASTTEIIPAHTAPVVTVVQSGSHHDMVEEQQRVQFASLPMTGEFVMTFDGPGTEGNGGVGPRGTITMAVASTAAQIQAAIRALPFYQYNNHPPIPAPGPWANYVFVTGTDITNILIEYQRGSTYPGELPVVQVNVSDVQYAFGYSITLPCTDPNFLDLFRTANAPAYVDVVLTPAGFIARLTAQFRLTISDPATPPTADFHADRTDVIAGDTVNFADTSTNSPTSWAWNFGDGGTSTAQNPTHVYTNSGSYTVSLVATNAFGSDTETKVNYMHVSPMIGPPGGGGETTDVAFKDGDWSTAVPVDIPESEHPFPQKPGVLIYEQPFWQWRLFWQPAALDTIAAFDNNAVLIGETPRVSLGGGDLITWKRRWARVPGQLIDYEVVEYPYQVIFIYTSNGAQGLFSMSLTRTAKVTRTFYNTILPQSIALARLPRALLFNNVIRTFDGFVNLLEGDTTIACDDKLERWEGNIWVKTEKQITI